MHAHWLSRFLMILLLSVSARGAVVEEVIEVRVKMKTPQGQDLEQPIKVTVFRDDVRVKAPYLILHHGRAVDAAGREKLKRARYYHFARLNKDDGLF